MIYIQIALKDIGNASVEQLLRRLTGGDQDYGNG